jgi:Putative auto-transporter adhesin, head GIN domain
MHLCSVKPYHQKKRLESQNLIIMKQLFMLFIGVVTMSTFAKAETVTREVDLTSSVYSIEVSNDINVVLTQSKEAKLRITGDEKDSKAVLFDQKNGRVRLLSKKGSLKNKVTVYVPVQDLRKLVINGQSYVRSNGVIASKSLRVVVAGEAKVEINNLGDIAFEADQDIDLQIKKWHTSYNKQ